MFQIPNSALVILLHSDPYFKYDVDKLDIDKLEKVPSDLKRLKSKVDKSDIGELETTTVDFRKLIDLVKIKLLKRLNMMNWLKRVNAIQTTNISYLVKKTDYNTKSTGIKTKIVIMIMVNILPLKNLS